MAVAGETVEALVALLLLAPFADQQTLALQPPKQRIESVFVDGHAAVGEGLAQRIAVVLLAELGEDGQNEAAPSEFQPKVLKKIR